MCNWHLYISADGETLGTVRYGNGLREDTPAKLKALRKALRHAAAWANTHPGKREQVKIENCSCNGVLETVFPFLDGGVYEPEQRWAESDSFFLDESDWQEEAYQLWHPERGVIERGLARRPALERAEAEALAVLRESEHGSLVVTDKSGRYFSAQRRPLAELLAGAPRTTSTQTDDNDKENESQ